MGSGITATGSERTSSEVMGSGSAAFGGSGIRLYYRKIPIISPPPPPTPPKKIIIIIIISPPENKPPMGSAAKSIPRFDPVNVHK